MMMLVCAGPLPPPVTHFSILSWVSGWGSGPVPHFPG